MNTLVLNITAHREERTADRRPMGGGVGLLTTFWLKCGNTILVSESDDCFVNSDEDLQTWAGEKLKKLFNPPRPSYKETHDIYGDRV